MLFSSVSSSPSKCLTPIPPPIYAQYICILSPAACLVLALCSMSAIPHTRSFITSLVVGNDFLARWVLGEVHLRYFLSAHSYTHKSVCNMLQIEPCYKNEAARNLLTLAMQIGISNCSLVPRPSTLPVWPFLHTVKRSKGVEGLGTRLIQLCISCITIP